MGRARNDGESFEKYKERQKVENKIDKMRNAFYRVFKNKFGMVATKKYTVGSCGELRRIGARKP